jgi:iron-sulfur cluster assembly accessory protein
MVAFTDRGGKSVPPGTVLVAAVLFSRRGGARRTPFYRSQASHFALNLYPLRGIFGAGVEGPRSSSFACVTQGGPVSTTSQPDVLMTVTPVAGEEVKKFMSQEGVDPTVGGLRVSVQPGGCSGFKYGLLIEDAAAEDDTIIDQGEYRVFVDPFSAQYISGVIIDYTSSMQGSGFTFKNPNATGGCGCGSSFSA